MPQPQIGAIFTRVKACFQGALDMTYDITWRLQPRPRHAMISHGGCSLAYIRGQDNMMRPLGHICFDVMLLLTLYAWVAVGIMSSGWMLMVCTVCSEVLAIMADSTDCCCCLAAWMPYLGMCISVPAILHVATMCQAGQPWAPARKSHTRCRLSMSPWNLERGAVARKLNIPVDCMPLV